MKKKELEMRIEGLRPCEDFVLVLQPKSVLYSVLDLVGYFGFYKGSRNFEAHRCERHHELRSGEGFHEHLIINGFQLGYFESLGLKISRPSPFNTIEGICFTYLLQSEGELYVGEEEVVEGLRKYGLEIHIPLIERIFEDEERIFGDFRDLREG